MVQQEERRRCILVPREPSPRSAKVPRATSFVRSHRLTARLLPPTRLRPSRASKHFSHDSYTLLFTLSHWHRTWLSRERVASSPERALANLLNSVHDKTRPLSFFLSFLSREGRDEVVAVSYAADSRLSLTSSANLMMRDRYMRAHGAYLGVCSRAAA
jgi:hypothetical protein